MVSESCYGYVSNQNTQSEEFANWLIRLTNNHRNWGFGLCYLYLRNVRSFGWTHKRVYCNYRELGLNLPIKSRKLVRSLSLWRPRSHQPGLVDGLSAHKLEDCRNLQLFNVIDDVNCDALGLKVDFSLPSELASGT